jgi:lysophospholipase L1-like esterase
MTLRQSAALATLTGVFVTLSFAPAQTTDETRAKEAARIAKWGPQIAAFETQDAAHPPAPGGVVFVGSSTIRLWDLAKSFPDLKALNRGFGGSHLADTRAYLPRLVLKHKPRLVVVYAGGNDLAANKSPAEIRDDFQAVERAVHAALPDCRLAYIGVKPTLRRLALRAKEKELNDAIRAYAAGKPRTTYIDADAPFCDATGQPRADLLRDDKLHLNDAGYVVLSDLVRPVLAGP